MSDPEEKIEIVKILTEDIQSHREYIQHLYRNALYVGGLGLAASIALAIWILGERLDSSILQHRIDEALARKVDEITQIRVSEAQVAIVEAKDAAVADASGELESSVDTSISDARANITAAALNATRQAQTEVDQYLTDQLADEVRKSVAPELERLSNASVVQLAEKITFPAGFVAAFDRPGGCPEGWSDMGEELRGKTIVGAVRNPNDKYAFRASGGEESHTLKISEMPAHNHGGIFGSDGSRPRATNDHRRETAHNTIQIAKEGGGQPHNNMPPFVALYLCKKQ